jgi:hypothetical protein
MNDAEAYAIHADPSNREPAAGSARRVRPRPVRYDAHVPVRFSREMVEQVRAVADADGVTVSTWIRQAVRRELQRRRAEADELAADPNHVASR